MDGEHGLKIASFESEIKAHYFTAAAGTDLDAPGASGLQALATAPIHPENDSADKSSEDMGPVPSVRGSEVRGFLGQSVTLPCTYSVTQNGETAMCWGRGQCSAYSCADTLIVTNGKTVTSRISTKFHLDGKIEEGDVSLTVDHLGEEDTGRYCCRVEIAGLFNDQIDYTNLLVLEAPSTVTIPPITTEHGNEIPTYTNSPTKQSSTPHSTMQRWLKAEMAVVEERTPSLPPRDGQQIPEKLTHSLMTPILLAFRVSVLICFIAITVLLCRWKCNYPAKEILS
ncbi:uncharacterized protein LOC144505351 [Mustelus asterias]